MCKYRGALDKYEYYTQTALETKEAIKKNYINGDSVEENSQGALAEVLYFKIVEGEQAEAIAKRLNQAVSDAGYFLEAGILGLKALFNALSAYGYTEAAYKTISHYDYPSYGYWKNCGATTLWENWNGVGSQNHHMYADVLNWMYRNVLGVKNQSIAYKECKIEPYFYAENCFAEGRTETPYGEIKISWQKTGNTLVMDCTIPQDINAMLVINGKELGELHSGHLELNL
jgi:alpha-L-rhamnosidase